MKTKTIPMSLCSALLFATILAGCSKSGANASTGLEPSKIPATVAKAFDKSSAEVKQEAASYIEAFQGQDTPAAFNQLRRMRADNDLTPTQRAVIARAMQTTFKQLQTAAQGGNSAAQTVMHQYLSSR